MRLERTYTLPTCTLYVTGIGGEDQVMTILTGFEVVFQHDQTRIGGGRELLDTLLKTVNLYTLAYQRGQEQITPISPTVVLEAAGADLHRLTVKLPEAEPVVVTLNTVQLFDLMESMDRLCADPLTLPDLVLDLPAPVNFRKDTREGLLPAISGAFALVATAIALYALPVPVPEPVPPRQPVPEQVKPAAP
jgi:hypothetical protein